MTKRADVGGEDRSEARPYGDNYPSAYGDAYGNSYAASEGFDIKGWLRFLRRRKVMISSIFIAGVAVTTVWAMQSVPVYTARSLVLIEGDQRIVDLGNSVTGDAISSDATIRTEINLLRSKQLLLQLVDRAYGHQIEQARLDPSVLLPKENNGWLKTALETGVAWLAESGAIAQGNAESLQDDIADEENLNETAAVWIDYIEGILPASLGGNQSDDVMPLMAPDEAARFVRNQRLGQLQNGLSVSQVDRSFVIAISYRSTSPGEAAMVANRLAALYVDDRLRQKRDLASGANEFLERRLLQLEQEVRASEVAIEEFIRDNDSINPANLGVGGRQLDDLTSMLVEARAARKERETRLQFIDELREQGSSLGNLTEVLQSPYVVSLWEQESQLRQQLAELRSIYSDIHPTVIDLMEEQKDIQERVNVETDRIVANLQNELQVARQRERSIQADIDGVVAKTGSAGENEIELRRLEREADATRQIYESFLQRFKETREQQELVEADARVIEEADPPTIPSSGSPNRKIAMGAALSLAFGIGLAFLREKLDDGVRSGKEIEAAIGLPYLGLTPFLSSRERRGKRIHQHMINKPLSAYTETIRQLYTVLRLSNVDKPPQVVQVTSAVPQEGKTTVAVSLAVALAMDGRKVALIDGDLRHPSVLRELPIKGKGCIVEYLTGAITLDQVIAREDNLNLDVYPVRKSPPNPAKLISSEKMSNLFEEIRSRYDYVIVDGPPVLGMSDSKALMELADTVLYVARWEKTTMDTVVDAVAELNSCNADIVGVVMTQVDVAKQAMYGYGGIDAHYGKYYNYYRN